MRPSFARCGLQLWIGEEKGPNNPGPSVSSRRCCYSGWAATMGMDGFGGRGSSRPQFSHRAAPSGFLCPQRKHTVVMFNFRGFPRQRPQLTQAYPHDMASSPCWGFCGCGRLREVPARGWMGRHWRAIVACFSKSHTYHIYQKAGGQLETGAAGEARWRLAWLASHRPSRRLRMPRHFPQG